MFVKKDALLFRFDFKKEDFELINVCKEIGYTLQAEVATCFEHSKKAQDEGRICRLVKKYSFY